MLKTLYKPQSLRSSRSFSTTLISQRKVLTLFGKEGCGLCDKAKEVMLEIRDSNVAPKDMEFQYVDISDVMNTQWWDKYCFDVPVLHIDDVGGDKGRVKMMHRLDSVKIMEEVKR
jgi:glutaredoxin